MLSEADNEILTRVGPGTLMGNLLRRYWLPALLSTEVPQPDSAAGTCTPALRRPGCLSATRDGDVGLLAAACPHRGASLFFGRNEEAGLRCVYHGWKFDTTGACIDMPSEPAESQLQEQGAARRPTRRMSPAASSGPTWGRRTPAALPQLRLGRSATRASGAPPRC